jgi:hypothetical protein
MVTRASVLINNSASNYAIGIGQPNEYLGNAVEIVTSTYD